MTTAATAAAFKDTPTLVKAIVGRDAQAFNYLYDHYSPALYGVIIKILKQEEIANEVLQETFVKIWNNTQSYDASKGTFYTWMLNIGRNLSIDTLRSKDYKNQQKNQSFDNSVSILESRSHTALAADTIGIRQITEQLPEDQRILIEYAYFRGYTQQEIADELDIPLGTVKTRIRTALQTLRKFFIFL